MDTLYRSKVCYYHGRSTAFNNCISIDILTEPLRIPDIEEPLNVSQHNRNNPAICHNNSSKLILPMFDFTQSCFTQCVFIVLNPVNPRAVMQIN